MSINPTSSSQNTQFEPPQKKQKTKKNEESEVFQVAQQNEKMEEEEKSPLFEQFSLYDLIKGDKTVAIRRIENAIDRVFQDDERAILELAVNGLDASVEPHNSVGNFGTGFFSILNYCRKQACTIEMETTYEDENKKLHTLLISISPALNITINPQIQSKNTTGTSIALIPQKGFDPSSLKKISEYLFYLQFYPHGNIEIKMENSVERVGLGDRTLVQVEILENLIKVVDHGCGVTPEIVKTKLLVPSESSKTPPNPLLHSIQLPQKVDFKICSPKNQFIISSAGVVVTRREIDLPFKGDIHLPLPSFNPVLARNAIQMNPLLREYLRKTIEASLNCLLANEISSETILGFYKGLEAWEEEIHESSLINEFDHMLFEKIHHCDHVIPVPFEYYDFFAPYIQARLLPIHGELIFHQFQRLEQILQSTTNLNPHSNLIKNKIVFFIKDHLCPHLKDCGLRGSIFAPYSLFEKAIFTSKENKIDLKTALSFSICNRWAKEGEMLSPLQASSLFHGLENAPLIIDTNNDLGLAFSNSISIELEGEYLKKIPEDLLSEFMKNYGEKFQEEVFKGHLPQQSNCILDIETFFLDNFYKAFLYMKTYSEEYEAEEEEEEEEENSLFKLLNADVILDNGKYYAIKQFEDLWEIEAKLSYVDKDKTEIDELKAKFKDEYFKCYWKELSNEELTKLFLEQLFIFFELNENTRVFQNEATLWPLENTNLEPFAKIVFSLLRASKSLTNLAESSNVCPNISPPVIFSQNIKTLSFENLHLLDGFDNLEHYLDRPIKQTLIPLIALAQLIQNNLSLSKEAKIDCYQYISRTLDLYHNYLTFSDRSLQSEYGGSTNFTIEITQKYVSVDDIFRVLIQLSENPKRLNKLLRLAAIQNKKLLNIERRDSNIEHYTTLYLPNPLGENILSCLTAFLLKEQNYFPAIERVIDQSGTSEELFLLLVYLAIYGFSFQKNELSDALIIFSETIDNYFKKQDLKHICLEIEKETMDRSLYVDRIMNEYEGEPEIFLEMHGLISNLLKNRNAFQIFNSFFTDIEKEKLENASSFQTSQLLSALETFSLKEIAEAASISKTAQNLTGFRAKKSPLVRQCVEASERDSWKSFLLEGLQNSADAVGEMLKDPKLPQILQSRSAVIGNQELVLQQLLTVDFNVEILKPNHSDPQLILTIKDGVGMKSSSLFWIPHKSEKKGGVGEMGNGTFQMFKDAEMVSIKTRLLDTSKIVLLKITPFRDEKGSVIDLSYKCCEIDNEKDFFGTEIRLLLQNQQESKEIITAKGLTIRNFVRDILGNTYIPHGNRVLMLNLCTLDSVVPLQVLDTQTLTFSIPFSNSFLSFLPSKNKDAQGYVLTGGIPFKSMKYFFVEHKLLSSQLAEKLCKGWNLNLPVGSYTPMQSRTQVRLTPEFSNYLRWMIAEWCFWRAVVEEDSGLRGFFPYLESKCGSFHDVRVVPNTNITNEELISQLQTEDESVLPHFFSHFIPINITSVSFSQYIKENYTCLIEKIERHKTILNRELSTIPSSDPEGFYQKIVEKFQSSVNSEYQNWENGTNNKVNMMIKSGDISPSSVIPLYLKHLIFPWFKNKRQGFLETIPSLYSLKTRKSSLRNIEENIAVQESIKIIDNNIEDLTKIYELLNNSLLPYVQQFQKNNKCDLRFCYDPDSTTTASYQKNSNAILINLKHCKPSEIIAIAYSVACRRTPLPKFDSLSLIEIRFGKAGSINHELEHARRASSHLDDEPHKDGIGANGKLMPFEACAASYARKAIEEGLYDLWADKLLDIFVNYDDQSIQTLIQKLQYLERENYSLFARKLIGEQIN